MIDLLPVDLVRTRIAALERDASRVLQQNAFRCTGQRLAEDDGLVDCWCIDRRSR